MRRFPEKLGHLRDEYYMTQRDLAEKLGLTQGFIHLMESGKRKPSLDVILRIAEIFHITPNDLLLDDVELPFDEL